MPQDKKDLYVLFSGMFLFDWNNSTKTVDVYVPECGTYHELRIATSIALAWSLRRTRVDPRVRRSCGLERTGNQIGSARRQSRRPVSAYGEEGPRSDMESSRGYGVSVNLPLAYSARMIDKTGGGLATLEIDRCVLPHVPLC